MPFIRKTTRQLSRHVISLKRLTTTNWEVMDEIDKLGLWCEQLDKVDVYLIPVSYACYGWYSGNIYIPAISGANLSDYFARQHTRLKDVLRHEWAHAFAEAEPKKINSKKFESVFLGRYESMERVSHYNPARHLTPYASASACEDFAETFHFYLRHKGKLPTRLANKPVIVRKWNFIASMATP
jgi:hypothetical protein